MLGYFLVFLVSFFLGRLTMTSMNPEQVFTLSGRLIAGDIELFQLEKRFEPLKKYFLGIHVSG